MAETPQFNPEDQQAQNIAKVKEAIKKKFENGQYMQPGSKKEIEANGVASMWAVVLNELRLSQGNISVDEFMRLYKEVANEMGLDKGAFSGVKEFFLNGVKEAYKSGKKGLSNILEFIGIKREKKSVAIAKPAPATAESADESQAEVQEIMNSIEKFNSLIQSNEKLVSDIKQKIIDAKNTPGSDEDTQFKASLANLEEMLTDMETNIDTYKKAREELIAELPKKEAEKVRELVDRKPAPATAVEEAPAEDEEVQAEQVNYKQQKRELNRQIKDLRAELEKAAGAVYWINEGSMQGDLAQAQAEEDRVREELTRLEAELSVLQQGHENWLMKRLRSVKQSIGSIGQSKDRSPSPTSEAPAEDEEVTPDDVEKRKQAMRDFFNSLREKATSVVRSIKEDASLAGQVRALERQIDELDDQIGNLDQGVSHPGQRAIRKKGLESRRARLQAQLESLSDMGFAPNVRGEIATVFREALAKVQTETAKRKRRIAELTAKSSSLSAEESKELASLKEAEEAYQAEKAEQQEKNLNLRKGLLASIGALVLAEAAVILFVPGAIGNLEAVGVSSNILSILDSIRFSVQSSLNMDPSRVFDQVEEVVEDIQDPDLKKALGNLVKTMKGHTVEAVKKQLVEQQSAVDSGLAGLRERLATLFRESQSVFVEKQQQLAEIAERMKLLATESSATQPETFSNLADATIQALENLGVKSGGTFSQALADSFKQLGGSTSEWVNTVGPASKSGFLSDALRLIAQERFGIDLNVIPSGDLTQELAGYGRFIGNEAVQTMIKQIVNATNPTDAQEALNLARQAIPTAMVP